MILKYSEVVDAFTGIHTNIGFQLFEVLFNFSINIHGYLFFSELIDPSCSKMYSYCPIYATAAALNRWPLQ